MPEIPSELRVLVTLGLGLLLVLLRLDAERFGAAEYDEDTPAGGRPSLGGRIAWYVLGVALVVGAVLVRPAADLDLGLGTGSRGSAVLTGLLYAALGTAQAVGFAWLRYRHLRLPPVSSYPNALVNCLATAFVDEAAFRGILLGFMLAAGLPAGPAIVIQALVYALATRTGAPGRDPYMLGLSLGIGLVGGWATASTAGIGAAFFGHAVTRFAVFLCTGHAGRFALGGLEPEEMERRRRPPAGWRVVGARDAPPER